MALHLATRTEILDWINPLLKLSLTRIEQLASGSIYCQLLDAAYPQKIPLHKVKWNAKLETEFIHNFKVLQWSFERLGINKNIPIEKLVKAKYQDNLQFSQWIKAEFEEAIKSKVELRPYDALKRRNFSTIDLSFAEQKKIRLTFKADDKENLKLSNCRSSGDLGRKQSHLFQPSINFYPTSPRRPSNILLQSQSPDAIDVKPKTYMEIYKQSQMAASQKTGTISALRKGLTKRPSGVNKDLKLSLATESGPEVKTSEWGSSTEMSITEKA